MPRGVIASQGPKNSSMNYWDAFSHTIIETLQLDRIGPPVFVRCTVALKQESSQTLINTMAIMVCTVNAWFSSPVERIYSLDSADHDHLTVTLEYPSGATALLSITPHQSQAQIDLIILGSNGAIYHNDPIQPPWGNFFSDLISDQARSIIQALEKSLATTSPVDVIWERPNSDDVGTKNQSHFLPEAEPEAEPEAIENDGVDTE